MKKVNILIFVLMLGLLPSLGHADEFGSRFYDKTPAGMQDFTASGKTQDIALEDDLAGELQKIAPAAGEEESKSDSAVENKAQEKE